MRGRVWGQFATVVAVLGASIGPGAGTAGANHASYTNPERKLGWSACAWAPSSVVGIAVDPAYPVPDSTYTDRLADAVARWNLILSSAARPIQVVLTPPAEAEVLVQYRAIDGADPATVLGETYLRRQGDTDFTPNIGRCPDRQAASNVMVAAQVRLSPRNDWFTGEDSSVDVWQMCNGEAFRQSNSTLCAAQVDFASTLVHELGHTLVFYHPQTLDDIDGVPVDRSDSASTAAACVEATGAFDGQATMCAGQGAWRAEQRTLETWDVETAHKQYS